MNRSIDPERPQSQRRVSGHSPPSHVRSTPWRFLSSSFSLVPQLRCFQFELATTAGPGRIRRRNSIRTWGSGGDSGEHVNHRKPSVGECWTRVRAWLAGRSPRLLLRTFQAVGVLASAALVLIASVTARAQSVPGPAYTIDEVRSDFAQLGYVVDPPITWWTADYVSTFRVGDQITDRIVMVLVYPDSSVAANVRSRVEALEISNTGRLLRGFGISAWRGNVALVESTGEELSRGYTADVGMPALDSGQRWLSGEMVDAEFLNALDGPTVDV